MLLLENGSYRTRNIRRCTNAHWSQASTLFVYRTVSPFKKLASKKYIDSLGDTQQIEIFGDGQQFVAITAILTPACRTPYRTKTGLLLRRPTTYLRSQKNRHWSSSSA
jgi:hypothetical protein